VYIKASPLADEVETVGVGQLIGLDPKTLGRELVSKHGWSASEGKMIWAVEPLDIGDGTSDRSTCLPIDSNFGLQIPQDMHGRKSRRPSSRSFVRACL
jgi:hypothetical protein